MVCLFNQLGSGEGPVTCGPRNRAGRRDDAIMMVKSRESRAYYGEGIGNSVELLSRACLYSRQQQGVVEG